MATNVNATELAKVLDITPSGQNIMLVGKHGIGKSKIIENYFNAQGKTVIPFFLGQMSDPGDIIGLPRLNEQTGKTEFSPPWWFPSDNKPIVLFLDELNRARPEILQCIMDLTLNKTIAGKKLPQGTQIISAVNEGEEYQLTDLDPALISRFNLYYFKPTVQEWLLWAAKANLDNRVVEFISKNHSFLDNESEMDEGLNKKADRRSWERVSEILSKVQSIDKTAEKIIAGIVGNAATLRFVQFVQNMGSLSPLAVLQDFEKNAKELEKLKLHDLTNLNEGIFRTLEIESDKKIIKTYTANIGKYINWLKTKEIYEALAHWTTLFSGETYPKSKLAIMTTNPAVFDEMVNHIKELDL